MISWLQNISDAMDIEPAVRDIVASYESLPVLDKARERIANSDFYTSYVQGLEILKMLDDYYSVGIDETIEL